ncbi:MAG TPA: acyl transferase [Chitinophagales bacterium]|nr:acyl transferase [Chitinophagales bacterium]
MNLVRDILRNPAFDFSVTCLQTFQEQAAANPVYKAWLEGIQTDPQQITHPYEIPFLPVELFKTHTIRTGHFAPELSFMSSGTTGQRSTHDIASANDYTAVLLEGFRITFGPPEQYRILCLLPSYHETGHSSLVFMCRQLMQFSAHPDNGFYHGQTNRLLDLLYAPCERPTILIGVSYALLDLAENVHAPLQDTIVVETGGMKGRRVEMIRDELHEALCAGFGLDTIYSEYGMTELLSQAWSSGGGIFYPPPWMQIQIADAEDPFHMLPAGRTGLLQIIDLANQHSCSFIGTRDLGRLRDDGGFEVLGRADNSDIRGCNLLIT